MNVALLVAAVLALVTASIHFFVGGPLIARPLLRSTLPPVPQWTHYYCWHLVSIALVAMAGGFAYAAVVPSGRDVAVLTTGLAVAFMVWSLVLIAWRYRHPWRLPQWSMFAAVSAAALIGLAG